ncbi:hypothetical protein [Seongchinamella sediminis]|uniref:hypothetical protein n=1 Tax=Seongchinamella sediminis TaxID=2283635 RepID=UPI001058BEFB|nr:hypothetical protein [Seongchinamella sediminis]
MSSFATDVVVAQQPMCERETIERAVQTLDQALHDSAAPAHAGDPQLRLALNRSGQHTSSRGRQS